MGRCRRPDAARGRVVLAAGQPVEHVTGVVFEPFAAVGGSCSVACALGRVRACVVPPRSSLPESQRRVAFLAPGAGTRRRMPANLSLVESSRRCLSAPGVLAWCLVYVPAWDCGRMGAVAAG